MVIAGVDGRGLLLCLTVDLGLDQVAARGQVDQEPGTVELAVEAGDVALVEDDAVTAETYGAHL